jgi:hypothetical protein
MTLKIVNCRGIGTDCVLRQMCYASEVEVPEYCTGTFVQILEDKK